MEKHFERKWGMTETPTDYFYIRDITDERRAYAYKTKQLPDDRPILREYDYDVAARLADGT